MATSNAWPYISFPKYPGGWNVYRRLAPRGTHPERTWRSLQYECIYGLNAFRRLSLFIRIQSLTSFSTASLLFSEAINDLLKIFETICSNVGTFGLGVRGVLAFDEWVGVVGVVFIVGLASRELFLGSIC